MARQAGELLRGAGATQVIRMNIASADPPRALDHAHGDLLANASVLDENAKSRFIDDLYVADNAALANALAGRTRH
jgi:hypothetical protein